MREPGEEGRAVGAAVEEEPLARARLASPPHPVHPGAVGAVIARYDLATGLQVGTLEAGPAGAGTTLAVDPEERLLVVAREEGPTVDLMLAR